MIYMHGKLIFQQKDLWEMIKSTCIFFFIEESIILDWGWMLFLKLNSF